MKRKIDSFEKVLNYLSKIPDINCGGCGIAAYASYLWMKQNQPKVKVNIVYCYRASSDECYLENEKLLKRLKGYPKGCSHAVIQIDDKYYDCDGERDIEGYEFNHRLPISVVIKTLMADNWNYDFDRRTYCPRIERDLMIELFPQPKENEVMSATDKIYNDLYDLFF